MYVMEYLTRQTGQQQTSVGHPHNVRRLVEMDPGSHRRLPFGKISKKNYQPEFGVASYNHLPKLAGYRVAEK